MDRGRLVFLGGSGPDNWELVVDLTRDGRKSVRFTGDEPQSGASAVKIAGSVDADHDGSAEVFVVDSVGASVSSLTIFTLEARRLVQVTVGSRPVQLKQGATVTHADGFQCAGQTLVVRSESTGPPDYKTVSYQRTTYTWDGSRLRKSSHHSGTFTGVPEVHTSCGDL